MTHLQICKTKIFRSRSWKEAGAFNLSFVFWDFLSVFNMPHRKNSETRDWRKSCWPDFFLCGNESPDCKFWDPDRDHRNQHRDGPPLQFHSCLLPHPIWGTKLAKSRNGSSLLLTSTEGPQQIQLRRRRRHTKKKTWWIRASSLVLFLQATSSHDFPAIEKLHNSGHHRRKPIVDAAATKWADKLQCHHGGTTTTTITVPLPNSSSSQAESQVNLQLSAPGVGSTRKKDDVEVKRRARERVLELFLFLFLSVMLNDHKWKQPTKGKWSKAAAKWWWWWWWWWWWCWREREEADKVVKACKELQIEAEWNEEKLWRVGGGLRRIGMRTK